MSASVTIGEIAKLCGVKPRIVDRWIDCGELPAVRLGHQRVRVRSSDVEALVVAKTTARTAEAPGCAENLREAEPGPRLNAADAQLTISEPVQPEPARADDLRGRVLSGGRALLIRQCLGVVVSVAGMLLLTRFIGPAAYGVYAAAFSIAFFIQMTAELSLDIYLVRHQGELPAAHIDQVFTLLVVSAGLMTCLSLACTPLINDAVHLPGYEWVAAAMFASLPLVHLQQVPLSLLEREFSYNTIGVVELVAQTSFFAVAAPLAIGGAGAWAPVAGWWTQQLILLAGFWRRETYRPSLVWNWRLIREIVSYGVLTTSSNFVFSLRTLVGPLLVGHLLGAAAVGFVALAIRISEQLAFARQVTFRISIAMFAKVASQADRFRRAMTQAAEVQLLAVGVPTAGFALLAGALVPIVFGSRWAPVAHLIPLLAAAYMATALFSMQGAVMALRRRPWDLFIALGSNAVLLWVASLLFVPRFGIEGYGYAELVAICSWLIGELLMLGRFPRPDYINGVAWLVGLSAIALARDTSWWVLIVAAICFLNPGSIRELHKLASAGWRA